MSANTWHELVGNLAEFVLEEQGLEHGGVEKARERQGGDGV